MSPEIATLVVCGSKEGVHMAGKYDKDTFHTFNNMFLLKVIPYLYSLRLLKGDLKHCFETEILVTIPDQVLPD
jgi:hypothetical protein